MSGSVLRYAMVFNNNRQTSMGKYNSMWELNTDMSKLAFLTIVTLVATILSPSVVENTFVKSSDGNGGDDKEKVRRQKKRNVSAAAATMNQKFITYLLQEYQP